MAYVNSVTAFDISGSSVPSLATAATSHTAGNLLVVGVAWFHADNTISSVTNTAGDTFTAASARYTDTNDNRVQLQTWYSLSSAGHASDVVTATFSANTPYIKMAVLQFSGMLTASGLDVIQSNFGTGSAQSVTVTTTQADEVVVSIASMFGGTTFTQGSGYTLVAGSLGGEVGVQFKILSATLTGGSVPMTSSSSGNWTMQAVSFKAASGGGSSQNLFYRRRR